MKLLLIIASLALTVNAVPVENNKCNIMFDGQYKAKDELLGMIDKPYLLTVDAEKNELYYSFSASLEDNDNKAAKIDITTKTNDLIKGIENGFATAINTKDKEIYIGGSGGIYKLDKTKNNTAVIFGEEGKNICNMYYSDALYFSVFPDRFVYTAGGKKFGDLENTSVNTFILDDKEIYYTNDTGLFTKKRGGKETVLINDLKGKNDVRALTKDLKGKLYLCLQDGIYSVDVEKKTVDKVLHIDDAFGLAFDKENNPIYSDAEKIVRLIPDASCSPK